jgi:hypothetical protein
MFCGCASHLDEFCFRHKRIKKRHLDYARNSYCNEFTDFRLILILVPRLFLTLVLCLTSFMDLSITHMVLVHERIALCLDTLVMAHVLIVVIVSHIGMVFLLESLTLTLSLDSWTVHIFPVMVHVPLVQRVRCKRL